MNQSALTIERALWWGRLLFVLVLAVTQLLFSDFMSQVITKALWLGIAAASPSFLASYVGMVSLGRVALCRIAGF